MFWRGNWKIRVCAACAFDRVEDIGCFVLIKRVVFIPTIHAILGLSVNNDVLYPIATLQYTTSRFGEDPWDACAAASLLLAMEPQLLPLDAATLAAYYPWCKRGVMDHGGGGPPSVKAACADMCQRLFPCSLALSPSAPGGCGGTAVVLELLEALADFAKPPSPEAPTSSWWGLRASALSAAAPCLGVATSSPSLPGDKSNGDNAQAVVTAAQQVVASALAPTAMDGGEGHGGASTAEVWRRSPEAAANALPPGLRRAAAAALAPHVGKPYDNTSGGSGNDQLPPFGTMLLGLLYALPVRDRNRSLGLAGSASGGQAGGGAGGGAATTRGLGRMGATLSSGGGVGNGGSGSGGGGEGAGGCLAGCDAFAIASCLAADVKQKQLSNLEVEHLGVLAACVQAQCAAADASATATTGGSGGNGGSDSSGGALSGEWPQLFASLKAWLFVALCDPDGCALAASVLEAFATRSPLKDQVSSDELLLPSLKLCFPNGGGAGDPTCEGVFAQLLRRLSGAGPRHASAVADLLTSCSPPKGSPLAALAAELRE